MTNIHNTLLRGLNSVLQQAPYVPDASTRDYHAQDVQDLLLYARAWYRTISHHRNAEVTTFFPLIEKVTGIVDLMDELQEEHESFEYGLKEFTEYVELVVGKPYLYRWRTLKGLIASFAPALVYNLHDQIDFLLSMDRYDGEAIRRCWLETLKACREHENDALHNEILPFIVGNSDKTYEGGETFPTVPKRLLCALKLKLKKKHRGAWRFNCCDFAGRPVPLRMLPENRDED